MRTISMDMVFSVLASAEKKKGVEAMTFKISEALKSEHHELHAELTKR